MNRWAHLLFVGALLSGCDSISESIADAWVRRNFRADQAISGFSARAETVFASYPALIRAREETHRDPDRRLHEDTTAALQSCSRGGQPVVRTPAAHRHAVGRSAPIAAAIVMAIGDMIIVEANAQLNNATDRLIEELTTSSAAAVTVPRLHPGTGSACFVVSRWGARPDHPHEERVRLWEFAFVVQQIAGARDAIAIQPLSLVFERSAVPTRDGGTIDLDITVTVNVPGPNDAMTERGATVFRLRGRRPGPPDRQALTDCAGTEPPNLACALRPRIGTAFVGPGERFSVIGVAVTEAGSGADEVRRERAFRERHQQAVRDLFQAIAGDRLGVAPLPGR